MAKKVIDMIGVARLLGVAEVTPPQWRQRSQKGELWPPLPDTDFPEITDKPLWFEDTIIDWAQRSDRWPPGKAARTGTRGPRRSHRTTHEELILADRLDNAA
jgi:hypothetical protein